MSRHSSMGSFQPTVYNYPLSEQFLKSQHCHPMISQYSNRSFASTSSGSYDSNQGSFMSTSPLQYDNYDNRHSAHDYPRHNSQGAAYDTEMCISPLDLHPKIHIESLHRHQVQRAVPSSDHRHIANFEVSHNKAVSQRTENRHHVDGTSTNTERDNKKREACHWPGCNATFSRKADVNRHFTSTHEVDLIDCDVKNCGRKGTNGFARKDHLIEHKRGYHCLGLPKKHIRNSKGRQQDC